MYLFGRKNLLSTSRLGLNRDEEIVLNRTKCDLMFRSQLYAHNFSSVPDPICDCGYRSQTTTHVLLECPLLNPVRQVLFNTLAALPDFNIRTFTRRTRCYQVNTLLNGSQVFCTATNKLILVAVGTFLKSCYV